MTIVRRVTQCGSKRIERARSSPSARRDADGALEGARNVFWKLISYTVVSSSSSK